MYIYIHCNTSYKHPAFVYSDIQADPSSPFKQLGFLRAPGWLSLQLYCYIEAESKQDM